MTGPILWTRRFGLRRERLRRVSSLERPVALTKRRKFVIVAFLLALYLLGVQNLAVETRYGAIAILAVLSFALAGWALFKDLRGQALVVNLILPTVYPVAVALFYFLLPQSLATRAIVVGVFGVSMYALMLTANIFAVASIRTIQLLRAARTVGFLLSVVTSALLFQVIFTLRLPFYGISLWTLVAVAPIILQGLWSYTLSERVTREVYLPTVVATTIVVEAATVLAFWYIEAPFASILLTMLVYVLLGLFQHKLEKRLFGRTVSEYMSFAILVLVIVTVAVFVRWMS